MKLIMTVCCHVDLCGAALSMLSAIKGLKRHGYKIIVIIPHHGKIEKELNSLGIIYFIIPLNLIATMNQTRFQYKILQKLYEILFYLKHEVISLIGLAKFIKHGHYKPDIIYTNTILPTAGIYLAKYYKVPHIVHVRELGDDDFNFKYYLGKSFSLKFLRNNTTKFICISKIVQAKWEFYFPKKTYVIYNGVRNNPIKNDFQKSDDVVKMLFVGRLSKEKGVWDLIEAMNILKNEVCKPKIHLDIYGEGIDKDIINQHVIERHLDDIITLKGYCASDAIPRYNYDLAIMSSHNEAFGRVTIEYMMSGLPVVAYNGGATIEIIENNISGLLYNNIPEMVLKIKSLIYDKKLRSTIGENGKEKAIKTFSEYQYMSNINMFFDEILKTGEK